MTAKVKQNHTRDQKRGDTQKRLILQGIRWILYMWTAQMAILVYKIRLEFRVKASNTGPWSDQATRVANI